MPPRADRADPWVDSTSEEAQTPIRPLTREEARALAARNPSVSPWRVLAVQLVVGSLMAVIAWLWSGDKVVAASVLYGAAAVVVPGALMARGMTSKLTSVNPGVSAVSFMLWEFAKIGISVAMLVLAPKVVPGLSWPALLVTLIVCIKVYWVALSWRGRSKS